jgi:hypothetical protein
VVVSAAYWKKETTRAGLVLRILCVLVISAGLGYANTEGFGDWLLNLHVPAITRGINPTLWFPTVAIKVVISNNNILSFGTARIIVAVAAGVLIGVLGIFLSGIIHRLLHKAGITRYSFGAFLIVVLLVSGYILSPIMGGEWREDGLCRGDVLKAYEQVGKDLARIIPAGSAVYWDVSNAVPLLYLQKVNIYPAQIYSEYSYRLGGDTAQLEKHGYWNETLAAEWAAKADVLVFRSDLGQTYPFENNLDMSRYDEFQTVSINPCKPELTLVVYRRKP